MTKTRAKTRANTPAILAMLPLLATVLLGLASAARAQVCGDVSGDDKITTGDAQRVLKASVGQDVELICSDNCAALEERVAALEALLANVTVDGNNLVLTGMNLQVVSGSGETDGDVNGKGNIIIGYDEADDSKDEKSGSHNLILGLDHSYESWGGIVAGRDNVQRGEASSILGGVRNSTEGAAAVVVAGQDNQADGSFSVVVGGEENRTSQRSCAIASGFGNLCAGVAGGVSGGAGNTCTGNAAVLSGGSSRILNTNGAWLAGSLFQAQ